jgi:hypothetical protein
MTFTLSIRSKLFLSILFILVVSYTILLYATIRHVNASLEQKMDEDLEANLRYAQGQYLVHANEIRAALQTPALTSQLHQGIRKGDRTALEKALVQWKNGLPSVDILLIADEKQHPLAQISGKLCTPRCLQLFDVFKVAAERRQPVITTELVPTRVICEDFRALCPPNADEEGETMLLVVAVPAIDAANRFSGCIIAADIINQDSQIPYRAKQIFGTDVEIAITLRGERIASTLKNEKAPPPALPADVLERLAKGLPYRGEVTIGDRVYKTAFEPITNIRGEFIGSLSVSLSRENFNQIRIDNLRNIIVSGVIGIILAFGMAILFARHLTLPLKALLTGVRDLEEGRTAKPLTMQVAVSDEFATLAGSFNMMLETLQEREREISHKTRALEKANEQLVQLNEELGQRVAERTAELRMEMGRLETILTSLVEGIVVTDRENRIMLFNPAAQRIFNLLPFKVMGHSFDTLSELAHVGMLRQYVHEMGTAAQPSVREEEIDAGEKRLKVSLAPLSDETGAFAGVVMSLRDITMEGAVDRMKTEFISTVSHELKTPLTSMKGSLDFLLERGSNLSETERELLVICLRNTSRLMRLINDILDITKIESGGVAFALKPNSMGQLVTDAVEELASLAAARRIVLFTEVESNLPLVYVDSDRIIQVITNLLANAIKFSPEGSQITISAVRTESHVAVSVADNGKSIEWSDREKLFKRFQQLDGSDRREHGGTGLGLAICKEIVERHHGRISYCEGEHGGNVFTFTVPVHGEEQS